MTRIAYVGEIKKIETSLGTVAMIEEGRFLLYKGPLKSRNESQAHELYTVPKGQQDEMRKELEAMGYENIPF